MNILIKAILKYCTTNQLSRLLFIKQQYDITRKKIKIL